MGLSRYDVKVFGQIVGDREGTWFTAHLIRLIARADQHNRATLQAVFPLEVAAYEAWHEGDGRTDITEYLTPEQTAQLQ